MSRIARLANNPRRTIAALATALVAAAVAVGSGAVFTAHSANPSNVFASGALAHSNSKNGSAILSLEKMKPGDNVDGAVTLTNTGDIPGSFTLSKSALVDRAGPNGGELSGKLDLRIVDKADGKVVYAGKLGAMGSLALGTYAPNEAHAYQFAVTFPDGGTPATDTTGDNAYKASSVSLSYDFAEVQ
jgi:spore coat-associated protein N